MLLTIVFIFLIVLIMVYFVIAYHCFRSAFVRERAGEYGLQDLKRMARLSPYLPQIAKEHEWFCSQVTMLYCIDSFDGLKLYARYLPAEKSKKFVLLFHGYHSSAENDFSCIVRKYHDMGYHLLLVDERAHNRSEGKYIAFGVSERLDCLDWIHFVIKTFGEDAEIFLHGMSMGATTVMLAAGLNLPVNVKGIIADCGFTSPKKIVANTIKDRYHVPPWLILPAMNLYCNILGKFDLNAVSTEKALKTSTLPLLLIHGNADTFVPTVMSRENFAASSSKDKKLILVDEAFHAGSYLLEPERCEKELALFLERNS